MRTVVAVLLMVGAATLAPAGDLQGDLLAQDRALWTAWGNADGEVFTKHLTEDHMQIVAGVGKVVGRDAIAAEVSAGGCKLNSFEFSESSLRELAKGVVMLSYVATQDASCGETRLPEKIQCTSIYVKKDGAWLSAAYQETPIE